MSGNVSTLEGCAEAFSSLAERAESTADEWARLDAAIERLEEPTSVMLLADVRVEVARRADRDGHADEALAACNRALASLPENADALVLRGALRRARGELELAEADWRSALQQARVAVADYADDAEEEEGEIWQEDPVCRAQVCGGLIAQHELALLLSQLGRHAEADAHLAQLCMRHKLSPALLEWARPPPPGACGARGGSGGGDACERIELDAATVSALAGQKRPLDVAEICSSGSAEPRDAEPVAILDGVLPLQLARALFGVFSPDAPFWREHGYPTPRFFSYLRQLPATGAAVGREAAGRGAGHGGSLMDALIDAVRPFAEAHARGLARAAGCARGAHGSRGAVDGGGDVLGWAEWWCHSRARDGGHQLHYDLDESSLRGARRAAPRSPIVSSILYLMPCSDGGGAREVGGPTAILEQRLGDGKLAERAWLVRAEGVEGGRLCLFDGGLLHGVMPGAPGAAAAPADGCCRRLTLMIGWWPAAHKPPRAARSNGPPFAPCMREPVAPSPLVQWPAQLLAPLDASVGLPPGPMPVRVPLLPVSPAWVRVPAQAGPRPRLAASTSGTGDDEAPSEGEMPPPADARAGADAPTAEQLAGGPALPADALGEVRFFGKWFLPSAQAIDDEVLGRTVFS